MRKAMLMIMVGMAMTAYVYAQPMSTVIKTQAIAMGRAIADHDKQTLMSFMLPELKEMMTGDGKKADMAMDSALAMFEAMGGRITRISYGDPEEVIKTKENWQTVLPQQIALSTSFADIEWTSTLLAISKDHGKHWYFTDPFVYREASRKNPLPVISEKLVIPPPQKPKITPKKQ